jgi:hypothetical protein
MSMIAACAMSLSCSKADDQRAREIRHDGSCKSVDRSNSGSLPCSMRFGQDCSQMKINKGHRGLVQLLLRLARPAEYLELNMKKRSGENRHTSMLFVSKLIFTMLSASISVASAAPSFEVETICRTAIASIMGRDPKLMQ